MAELATLPPAKTLEKLLVEGDLSGLSAQERIDYVLRVCESLGLNPTTKPFAYIKLNGKLVLYALRDCTEQLRKLHGVSVTGMTMQTISDVYVVSAEFRDKSGRTDQATGCVPIKGLSGENLANAYMKAETKCKRRGTLSICGMGMLDETEVATIPDAEAEGEKKFKKLKPITVPPEQQGIPYRLAPDPHVDTAEASHEAIGDTRTMAELDQQQELVMDPPPDPPPPASAGLPSPRITHKQHIDLECAIRELADASGADAD